MPKKSVKPTTKQKVAVGIPKDTFFEDIRYILADARRRAYTAVNFVMVVAYWKIGRRIVEEEQAGNERADYGTYLIRELSRRLGDEFGKGFSVANLRNFRRFYLAFSAPEIRYTVCSELADSENDNPMIDSQKLYTVCRELEDTDSQNNNPVDDAEKGYAVSSLSADLDSFGDNQNNITQIPYTLRRELSWSHFRLIMRVENPTARAFYIREAAEQNWSDRMCCG